VKASLKVKPSLIAPKELGLFLAFLASTFLAQKSSKKTPAVEKFIKNRGAKSKTYNSSL